MMNTMCPKLKTEVNTFPCSLCAFNLSQKPGSNPFLLHLSHSNMIQSTLSYHLQNSSSFASIVTTLYQSLILSCLTYCEMNLVSHLQAPMCLQPTITSQGEFPKIQFNMTTPCRKMHLMSFIAYGIKSNFLLWHRKLPN